MTVGTRSIFFGVHQFLFHPFSVLLAWIELYGLPSFKEVICILVHDWGYCGCIKMDGEDGERHPELGAKIVMFLFGKEYSDLVLYHSRTYASRNGAPPSKLCWADKLSIKYDPCWFYLMRATLSGEIKEYRMNACKYAGLSLEKSNDIWYSWLVNHMMDSVKTKKEGVWYESEGKS